ncbi:MAG: hypothetical protein ACE14L_09190 [Terriglobales bacterium]
MKFIKPFALATLVLCALAAPAQTAVINAELPNAPGFVRDEALAAPDLSAFMAVRAPLPGLPVSPLIAEPLPPKRKLVDKKFIALGILVFGLTALDVEMTQHCLKRRLCEELNPTLPRSHFGMYAVNTPVNAAVMYFSYRRRRSGKWGWWLAPVVDIGAHAAGVGSNVRWVMGK